MTSKYVINKTTNERYSIDGYVPLNQEQSNYIRAKDTPLPEKVDLRTKATADEEQTTTKRS